VLGSSGGMLSGIVAGESGGIPDNPFGDIFGSAGKTAGDAAQTATLSTAIATSAATSAAAITTAIAGSTTAIVTAIGASAAGDAASSVSSLFDAGSGFSFGDLASFGDSFGGFFADGGDPPMGKVSVVGERGPELFVPKRQGTIVPMEKVVQQSAATSQRPLVINNHFTIGGNVNRDTQAQISSAAGRGIRKELARGTA
jgi:hypothetical protein